MLGILGFGIEGLAGPVGTEGFVGPVGMLGCGIEGFVGPVGTLGCGIEGLVGPAGTLGIEDAVDDGETELVAEAPVGIVDTGTEGWVRLLALCACATDKIHSKYRMTCMS